MYGTSVHHVAYRCKDAKETADFYEMALGLPCSLAVSGEATPTTKENHPYMHIFLGLESGSFLAFFELPEAPEMGRDENTPPWVQHLALSVDSEETLTQAKAHLEKNGIEVVGPTDHKICKSIYFFDPNGHRIELAWDCTTPEMVAGLGKLTDEILAEWTKTKKPTKHHEAILAQPDQQGF